MCTDAQVRNKLVHNETTLCTGFDWESYADAKPDVPDPEATMISLMARNQGGLLTPPFTPVTTPFITRRDKDSDKNSSINTCRDDESTSTSYNMESSETTEAENELRRQPLGQNDVAAFPQDENMLSVQV